MRHVLCLALAFTIAGAAALSSADDEKPKYSIKQVMGKAFKGGLLKKVASGNASDDEKATLAEMLDALAAAKPKKGEEDSWKAKTAALVKAAKEGNGEALQAAANCKACHSLHK